MKGRYGMNDVIHKVAIAIDTAMRKGQLNPENKADYSAFKDILISEIKAHPEGTIIDLDKVAKKAVIRRDVEKVQSCDITDPSKMIKAGWAARNEEASPLSAAKENPSSDSPYRLIATGYEEYSKERNSKNE